MGFTGSASTIVNVSSAPATVNLTTPANLTTKNLYGAVVYGNGADGAVTISGTVTLTRDMQYLNLTVNAGATLVTAGWRVFVSGTLTNNGTIHNDAPGSSGAPFGSLAGGGTGGSGTAAAGNAGIAADTFGGIGGKGGAADTGALGGAGGDRALASALLPVDTSTFATRRVAGGSGGGGGGNAGSGGGGGGVLTLFAATLVNNGTISAAGAAGAAGSINAGGAGGGGGGVVVLVFTTRTGTSASASPGAGGSGYVAGAPGRPGLVAEVIV